MNDLTAKIPVGISSCLLGEEVRYDGGHKRDSYVCGVLGDYFEFRPFCPEVSIGLGVPRPTIRLVQVDGEVHVRGVKDASIDVTDALAGCIEQIDDGLDALCGYILKKGSPSCGMERVSVYSEAGMPVDKSSGRFARSLLERCPLLPVEEEGRLHDARLRENFISRVFTYRRWQQLNSEELTPAGLLAFHTRHKYLLMAHHQGAYRELGRSLSDLSGGDLASVAEHYFRGVMDALAKPASRRNHANVLQHLMGYLKHQLDADDKAELVENIDRYRTGLLPLIVPLTLLRHHFRRHPDQYISDQVYLDPHPSELMLLNHV